MSRPLLLDLFCCEGGAAMGYHRAGFDVVGVDIVPRPRYPFPFVQADALAPPFDLSAFDAIHASPPCQAFSLASGYHPKAKAKHLDLVDPTRQMLEAAGVPYVIENVIGAPMRADVMLCGEQFKLRVHRHRLFEVGRVLIMAPEHQRHRLRGADHNCDIADGKTRIVAGNYADHGDASDAMGIDWMSRKGLSQAIPPAYTEHIGRQLIDHVAC